MKLNAQELIQKLDLKPLPGEGGFFRETHRSKEMTNFRGGEARSLATAIYYLITPTSFSALHKLPVDETFHFYAGGTVEMLLIRPQDQPKTVLLGNRLDKDEIPQITIPNGTWQGSRLLNGDFALMGTTVYPGFEFRDLELASEEMILSFPESEKLIRKFLQR